MHFNIMLIIDNKSFSLNILIFKTIIEVFTGILKDFSADKAIDFFVRAKNGAYGKLPKN